MATESISNIDLNPNAAPFVPPRYYLVMNPRMEQGYITPAYYFPLPTTFNPQQLANPMQTVYPQMIPQYQPPPPPQYYVPAQLVDQPYRFDPYANNDNGYENGTYMNAERSVGENHRGRNQNNRGNSRHHNCDECHYQRQPKYQRNNGYNRRDNWNNGNGNNRNFYKQQEFNSNNYNVQYVDNDYNHSNLGYNHQNHMLVNDARFMGNLLGELDVEEIEASVSD